VTAYDKTLPSGSASIRIGDDKIRDNFAALEEALLVEHNFPDNAGGSRRGRHKFGVGTQGARTAAIGTPAAGEVWFDTTYYQWTVYDGTAWRALGAKIGDVKMSAIAPVVNSEGWLVCNGQLVSRVTYALLLAVIGLTYNTNGAGGPLVAPEDGTNFRVPNLGARTPVGWVSGGDGDGDYGVAGVTYGEKSHILDISEMPAHDHPGSDVGAPGAGVGDKTSYGDTDVSGPHNNRWRAAGTNAIGLENWTVLPDHVHSLNLVAEGGDGAHENRPPLITLSFLVYAGV